MLRLDDLQQHPLLVPPARHNARLVIADLLALGPALRSSLAYPTDALRWCERQRFLRWVRLEPGGR